MLDWIGSIDEKRTQEAMERLVELCDHTKGRRLTYLAVKNKCVPLAIASACLPLELGNILPSFLWRCAALS